MSTSEETDAITEPSAVAPDPGLNLDLKADVPMLISGVDSSIRRYRARFCIDSTA